MLVCSRSLPLSVSAFTLALFVYLVKLPDPSAAFGVSHVHNFLVTPAQMHCNKGYLLVQTIQGVA